MIANSVRHKHNDDDDNDNDDIQIRAFHAFLFLEAIPSLTRLIYVDDLPSSIQMWFEYYDCVRLELTSEIGLGRQDS
jgi:hypothetical protein